MNDTNTERTEQSKEAPAIQLIPQLTPVINYALQQNRLPILPQVTIQNHTDTALSGVTLTVESTPGHVAAFYAADRADPAPIRVYTARPRGAGRPPPT